MGTKVHCEGLLLGYHHSMRDLNNESNGCRWPFFGNNPTTSANDQCYNGGFPPSHTTLVFDKHVVRRTMIEHEAVFMTQVSELHRVYRTQKDMMDELKRKQFNKEWDQIEASCASQAANDDARKWKIPSFPMANSVYDRPSMSVVEDNGHSPMKGNISQGLVGPVSWQNGASSSRNAETSDVRPTKIRRKMIDLCLPADEYIDDTEEIVEMKDHRVCGTSSKLFNGNVKIEPRGDNLRIGYELSRNNGLTDLNEPFKAQETNEVAYGRSHVSRNGQYQGYVKSLNSGSVTKHLPGISMHQDVNFKPNVWPHQPPRIGKMTHKSYQYTSTHKSATPFIQPGKPLDPRSQPMQVLMNSSQRVMGLPNSGPPSKAVFWRERTFIDLEADTDTNCSHKVINESSLASHQPRYLNPYNLQESSVPWNHSQPSWQNPSFGFPQKVVSTQRYPVLNLSETISDNAQKQGYPRDRLQFESNPTFNSGCRNSTRSNHNMFYKECSSSSKSRFSGTGYNYPNGGRTDYSQANPFMDSNGSEAKCVRDLNLNVTVSNTSVVEVRKNSEQHVATLPWLVKPKPACNSEMASDLKSENKVQNLMWLGAFKSGSCSNKPETEKSDVNTKIPGFAYNDQCNAGKGKVHNVRMLDINEPCDTLSDEDQQTKVSVSNRCDIDLNMSVSEEEDENWSVSTSSRKKSKTLMIDLETVPESDVEEEENDNVSGEKSLGQAPVEFENLAAETIVALSSACLDRDIDLVASETIILHWFAETVDTHKENLDKKLDTFAMIPPRSIKEIDDFESLTLQLPEITEDEYMPKPLVPEDLRFKETSVTAIPTSQRPRRGNARKGKQKRDFQRDVLQGLLSLSKHEVTEDIHMFDGFMRATGSSWTPTGLARKKTGSRGRPRRVITMPEPVYCPVLAPSPLVQQQRNNGESEIGVEDRRSFAVWGNMTRRPRRQRCPSSSTTSNQRSSSLV
ncbi:unnamed protein product [Cochlearia groenlandica]